MAHRHPHIDGLDSHGHAGRGDRGRLAFALALTLLLLVVEAFGGWWSGSLALLADAAHMLVDAGALALAWAAAVFAMKPADARRSFGYARMEVLAGFVNSLVQALLVVWLVYEAVTRLLDLGNIRI
ncbi:MAG TPA: cation diffusion facilitator family transporter, partial [Rhodanobacteraceae bacterium]|nr:cation diffusion facilitator family transporter [Rhodanobacteraceae bacterium]